MGRLHRNVNQIHSNYYYTGEENEFIVKLSWKFGISSVKNLCAQFKSLSVLVTPHRAHTSKAFTSTEYTCIRVDIIKRKI